MRLFVYSFIHTLYSHSAIHIWHSRACSRSHLRSRSQATGAAVRDCRLWVDSGKVEPAKDEQHKQNREKTEAKASETKRNRTEQRSEQKRWIKAETQKQSKPTNEARQGRRRDADDDVLTVTNCSKGSCLGDLLLPRLLGLCSWPENKKQKQRREVKRREEKKMNSASRQKSPCGLHCCGNDTTTALLTETETSAASSMPASASALAVTYCSPTSSSFLSCLDLFL